MYNYGYRHVYRTFPNQIEYVNKPTYFHNGERRTLLKDYGEKPFVVDIEEAIKQNNNYRTALWTGSKLQVTVMSLNVGQDIDLEIHPHVDIFLRIEQGRGACSNGS